MLSLSYDICDYTCALNFTKHSFVYWAVVSWGNFWKSKINCPAFFLRIANKGTIFAFNLKYIYTMRLAMTRLLDILTLETVRIYISLLTNKKVKPLKAHVQMYNYAHLSWWFQCADTWKITSTEFQYKKTFLEKENPRETETLIITWWIHCNHHSLASPMQNESNMF